MWIYSTRCRPGMNVSHFDDVQAYPLVPYMSHGPGSMPGGKVVANCMFPVHYSGGQARITFDPENDYSKHKGVDA
jgi:hypothetical protein